MRAGLLGAAPWAAVHGFPSAEFVHAALGGVDSDEGEACAACPAVFAETCAAVYGLERRRRDRGPDAAA